MKRINWKAEHDRLVAERQTWCKQLIEADKRERDLGAALKSAQQRTEMLEKARTASFRRMCITIEELFGFFGRAT